MLKNMKFFVVVCVLAFATQSHSIEVENNCNVNCVSTEKSGSSLILTWYSEEGAPVKSFLVDLPQDAVAVSTETTEGVSAKNDKIDTTSGFDEGKGHVEYDTYTFETETEYVIVTITKVFNGRGILISVQNSTLTIPIVGRARKPK